MPTPLVTPLVYLTVALVWAGGWIAGKVGVAAAPPLELSAVRYAIAGVLLLAITRLWRVPLPTGRLGLVALAAAFGVLGYNAFVFVGLTLTPASDAALIVPTLVPVLTAVAATSIGEPLTGNKVLGLVVSSAGAALVIATGGDLGGELSERRLAGDLLHLAGAACWAGYATIGAVVLRGASPLAYVTLTSCLGAAMLFPLGFLERGYTDVPSWTAVAWSALGFMVVFATVVGFVLFYWAVRRFGAGLGSMVTYLVPVATLALAFVVLGERPQPLQLVGGAVILTGVRLATWRRRAGVPLAGTAPA